MKRSLRLAPWMRRLLVPFLMTYALGADAAGAAKKREAAILARVLSYELTLGDRAGDRVGVAVLYKAGDAKSESNADEWFSAVQELSSLKIKDKPFFAVKVPFSSNALLSAIDTDGIDLVLVADGLGAETEGIAKLTRSKHVLSASNDLVNVQKNLTVCVVEQEGKLKIVINLSSAERESIRFSSNLLRLATILR